jgi:hypothetical protein
MRQLMVRHQLKPGRVEEIKQLVRALYEELRRAAPAVLRYGDRVEDGPVVTEVSRAGSYHGSGS